MQRIKLDVFHSLFEKELTGNEIDFIIALTHLQNGRGEAFGVHYKEMCEKMDISVQAFYDCKKPCTKGYHPSDKRTEGL